MNMPEIRFENFKNEWKHFSFKEITYKAGIKNSENLSLESYSISNELGFIPQKEQFENGGTMSKADKRMYFIVSSNSFAYNPARINVGSLGYYQGVKDVIVSSLYEVFKTSDIIDDLFLLYWFKTNIFKRMIEQYQEGGVRLYFFFDKLQKCQIKIPSLQEQQKIASYFQKLDSLIQTTSKKLASLKQIKAASLQSMFPQEGETVPKVRFKGFEEEWEKERLCNIASRITRKNKNLESFTPLTISAIEGLVSQLTYFNNIVASSNISGYYLIKNGEFAYNKSYSNGFPYGSIKRLDKFDMGVLSTLYIVFALNKQNTSILSDYLVIFFNTTLWHHEIAKRAEEGARNHGLLNISAEDFLDINIIYPKDLLEQQKIASYFCNLDRQISLQTQRLEKLKQIKAACLDKMFV